MGEHPKSGDSENATLNSFIFGCDRDAPCQRPRRQASPTMQIWGTTLKQFPREANFDGSSGFVLSSAVSGVAKRSQVYVLHRRAEHSHCR